MSHYEATTAEGIKVMVDAPEGALPEDATLNASLISDEGEKDSVASELDDAAVAYDGFMALDVSFTNAAGEEIEPSAAVNVRFEVPQGMLPEGAADLSVHHLAENEDGTVADVEAVADAAEKTDGTVTLADDNTLDAEFQVESFSSFVISWIDGRSTYFRVTVNYVDADGRSIGETQSKEVSIKNDFTDDYTVSFSDYAGNIDGYTFSAAHYGAVDGSEVASMTATMKKGGFLEPDYYYLSFKDSSDEQVDQLTYTKYPVIGGGDAETASIYLVYNEVVEPGITITDTVVKDGLFTATPTGGLELPTEGVTYQWERSLNGSTGWENVDRELVTGSHYNLENDGKSVNVAYDSIPAGAANNQRYWYRVTATVTNADGTETTYTSDALQVPYYIELQNGSFETPRNVSLTNQIVNGSQGVIWKTTGEGTGSHQGHDIEIVHPSYPGSMSNYHIDHTADGPSSLSSTARPTARSTRTS
ncbi:MucBP domain-containing protein [Thermophilibacter provencensis]|uniref:MucBP domain-containing protein n=1 Tax=Thermophilibacter provencensis TaxID=1852386 RepID=UPI002354E539|nr:MucBP domain-containing protein [Thermophilibacter provencensis]